MSGAKKANSDGRWVQRGRQDRGLFFFLRLRPAAYRILVPQRGMEPTLPAVEAQSPSHWTTGEFPRTFLSQL